MLLFVWLLSSLSFAIDSRYSPIHEAVKTKYGYTKDYNAFLEEIVVACQVNSVRKSKTLNIPFGEYLLICPWLHAQHKLEKKSPDKFDPETLLADAAVKDAALKATTAAGLKAIEQQPVPPRSEVLRLYLEREFNTKIEPRKYEEQYTDTCYTYVAGNPTQPFFLCLYFAAKHMTSGAKDEFWPASYYADLAMVETGKGKIRKKFPRARFAPGISRAKLRKYKPIFDALPAEKKVAPVAAKPKKVEKNAASPAEKQQVQSPKGVCGCASTKPLHGLSLLALLAVVVGVRRRDS